MQHVCRRILPLAGTSCDNHNKNHHHMIYLRTCILLGVLVRAKALLTRLGGHCNAMGARSTRPSELLGRKSRATVADFLCTLPATTSICATNSLQKNLHSHTQQTSVIQKSSFREAAPLKLIPKHYRSSHSPKCPRFGSRGSLHLQLICTCTLTRGRNSITL